VISEACSPLAAHESAVFNVVVDVVTEVVLPTVDDEVGECSDGDVVSAKPTDGASALQAPCRDPRKPPSMSVTEYADGQQAPDAAAALSAAAAAAADGVMGAW